MLTADGSRPTQDGFMPGQAASRATLSSATGFWHHEQVTIPNVLGEVGPLGRGG